MAQDDNEQVEAPVTRRDLEAYMQQLGGNFNVLAAQQQAIAQRLAEATAPPPPPPEVPTDEQTQQHVKFMLSNPQKYNELILTRATQLAEQKIEQRLQAEQARAAQANAANNFWVGFYQANPDLQAFHAEVLSTFANTNPQYDPSERANYARDVVRQKLQQVSTSTTDAEKRNRDGRMQAAGAPGSVTAPAGAVIKGGEEYVPSADLTADYLQERMKRKAERSGDKLIANADYWLEHKQKKLRLVDRQAAAKSRAA